MRRKRAVILCIICLLCTGALAGLELWKRWRAQTPVPYVEKIMGAAIVDDAGFLQDKERKTAGEMMGVCFEGIPLPFDSGSGVLYLPQNSGIKEWTGKLSVSSRENSFGRLPYLCAPQDAYWEDKQAAIRDNHEFRLWLVDGDSYCEFRMVITGTPMICINTERSEEPEEVDPEIDPDKKYFDSDTLYYGGISVFDPGVGGSYQILQANVCYHEKGASTKNFEKKGYSLNLTDYQGNKIDVSLLGMRADDSWKLNALYTDTNRIREITASQIWERFDEANTEVREPGPGLEYAELILDGDYRGLYCLVEPVDAKKLELDKNDVLYKVIDWTVPASADIQVSVERGWKVQYPIRLRYPKAVTNYAAAWYPMMEYINIFYENPELDYERAISRVDVSNLTDLLLFTMVTSASDNCFKNTYYAAEVSSSGFYVMKQIPWDLDYTFGNRYDYIAPNSVLFDENYALVYAEVSLPRLRYGNPEGIGLPLLERWNTYRDSFLSTEAIIRLLQDNRSYIMETGAAQREAERWPDAMVDMDIGYLLEFQSNRMEWLDEFFEGWALSD